MNDYYKVTFHLDSENSQDDSDILAALLGESADFESFDSEGGLLNAYVKSALFDKNKIEQAIAMYPFSAPIKWEETFVPGEDWNKEWEKNYFKPLLIADRCVIHSSFHVDFPAAEYDIVINPKMAFGTGHHETTTLMITQILEANMAGKDVLDMGTGTGVLAILCAMRGASSVKGVEIDEMAFENAVENVALNDVCVSLVCGDASSIEQDKETYDYVLANINRNIITADIGTYAAALRSGGYMQLSGFYEEDIPVIEKAAAPYGLETVKHTVKKNWTMLLLRKQ